MRALRGFLHARRFARGCREVHDGFRGAGEGEVRRRGRGRGGGGRGREAEGEGGEGEEEELEDDEGVADGEVADADSYLLPAALVSHE